MTDDVLTSAPDTVNEEFDFEPCDELHIVERGEIAEQDRDGTTLLKDVQSCPTASVKGLSQQIIDEVNQIVPNALVDFSDLNVQLGESVWSYLQPAAKSALAKALQDRGTTMHVNSAYRTIAQQLLLYNQGQRGACGIRVVARVGRSNHQGGLALDIEDTQGWRPYLEKYGWKWFGDSDRMHFDYRGAGTQDLRSAAILAFQKLWNKNNPNACITEDGVYGPQVEKCLNNSPSGGFGAIRTLQLTTPPLQGDDVKKLQEALIKAGFQLTADGIFGPGTDAAVKQFQQQKGLTADGQVGPTTRRELLGAL